MSIDLAIISATAYRIDMAKAKNSAAVELGRRGGKKKVPKGFAVLTEEERREKAKAGASARWAKEKGSKQAKRKAT